MAAVSRRGGRLMPWNGVEGFDVHRGRVTAIRTSAGIFRAARSWWRPEPGRDSCSSRSACSADASAQGTDRPLARRAPLIRRVVEHGKNYLVPRDDGRVLVGATEENVGFDTCRPRVGARELLELAVRLCPVLSQAEVEATWAGLRPGSVDTKPYIGPAPGSKT